MAKASINGVTQVGLRFRLGRGIRSDSKRGRSRTHRGTTERPTDGQTDVRGRTGLYACLCRQGSSYLTWTARRGWADVDTALRAFERVAEEFGRGWPETAVGPSACRTASWPTAVGLDETGGIRDGDLRIWNVSEVSARTSEARRETKR